MGIDTGTLKGQLVAEVFCECGALVAAVHRSQGDFARVHLTTLRAGDHICLLPRDRQARHIAIEPGLSKADRRQLEELIMFYPGVMNDPLVDKILDAVRDLDCNGLEKRAALWRAGELVKLYDEVGSTRAIIEKRLNLTSSTPKSEEP